MKYKRRFKYDIIFERPSRKGIFTKYRKFMSKLKKGDSFIIPISDYNVVYGAANVLGIKVMTRALSSSKRQVWRINNETTQI